MSALPVRLLGSLDGLPLYRSSIQADPDDNKATAQTVRKRCEAVLNCARERDPAVMDAAATAMNRYGNVALSPLKRRAWACWWYAKQTLKFVQDDAVLASLLNEHEQREALVHPPVMLRLKRPEGDCDDFTLLICTLLKVLGVPFEIVTISADPHEPDRWSHVYAVAVVEDGERLPLDASHGKYPGWEVPREHILRYQAWDESGAPIEGRGPSVRSRLNGYIPPRLARRVVRRRGMRGLGQDPPTIDIPLDLGSTVDTSSIYDTYSPASDPTGMNNFWNRAFSSPAPSSGSSAANTALIGSTTSAFTKMLQSLIAPQATVVGPGGLSVTGPANTVASIFSGTGLSTLGSGSLTPLLLLGGAALVVIMLMKK
jgi:hypothetical protein